MDDRQPPVGWQHEAAAVLKNVLSQDARVLGAMLFGSCATDRAVDRWSDLDILVVVNDDDWEHLQADRWASSALGPDAASMKRSEDARRVSKFIDAQGRAIDFVTVRASTVADGRTDNRELPARVLFSTDAVGDGALLALLPVVPAPLHRDNKELRSAMAAVRYLAREATLKARRGDTLIGLHLALRVVAEVCVALMAARDYKYGTVHHPGGREDDKDRLDRLRELSFGTTAAEVIELAEAAADLYEAISDEIQERCGP